MYREKLSPVGDASPVYLGEPRGVSEPCNLAYWQKSNGQAFPAAPASSSDYPTSTHCTHTLAEPVRLCSFATVWLISAFHETPLS